MSPEAMPAEAEPPPEQPPLTPLQPPGQELTQEAIDATIKAFGIEALAELLAALQAELKVLAAEAAEQSEQLRRLTGAAYAMPCPKGIGDPRSKDENAVAPIRVCMDSGLCDCDAGRALRAQFAPPPPPEPEPPLELAPPPEG